MILHYDFLANCLKKVIIDKAKFYTMTNEEIFQLKDFSFKEKNNCISVVASSVRHYLFFRLTLSRKFNLKEDNPGVIVPPKDGKYDTGDIVEIDEDGYITIIGRIKRFAKIAGEMVSMAMVESEVNKVWKGSTNAIIAEKDDKKGEKRDKMTSVKTVYDPSPAGYQVPAREPLRLEIKEKNLQPFKSGYRKNNATPSECAQLNEVGTEYRIYSSLSAEINIDPSDPTGAKAWSYIVSSTAVTKPDRGNAIPILPAKE